MLTVKKTLEVCEEMKDVPGTMVANTCNYVCQVASSVWLFLPHEGLELIVWGYAFPKTFLTTDEEAVNQGICFWLPYEKFVFSGDILSDDFMTCRRCDQEFSDGYASRVIQVIPHCSFFLVTMEDSTDCIFGRVHLGDEFPAEIDGDTPIKNIFW